MLEPASPTPMWIVQMPSHHGQFSAAMLCEDEASADSLRHETWRRGSDAVVVPVTVTIAVRDVDTENTMQSRNATLHETL